MNIATAVGWWAAWMVGLGLGLACAEGVFQCNQDDQCDGGVCVDGHCAFPSDMCSSGLQYGAHSGSQASQCVPPELGQSTSAEPLDSSPMTIGSTGEPEGLDTGAESSGDPDAEPVEFVDDAFEGEFAEGTFEQTMWSSGRLQLQPDALEGTFTSRVFDAGTAVDWQTVRWQPDEPYAKPLPGNGHAESGYTAGNVDMADNVLLMHLDGEGPWTHGLEVLDASGTLSHGTVVAEEQPVPLIPGVFGTAIDDHAGSRISIITAETPGLSFGHSDFTWSLWFRTADDCAGNRVLMGVENTGDNDAWPHLWLGCTAGPWDACEGQVVAPRVAGVLTAQQSVPEDGGAICSDSSIDAARWHHAVVTKQGHSESVLSLYFDGELQSQSPAQFLAGIEYPSGHDFAIGAFSRGAYNAAGHLDEVAIWTRALSPEQVAATYRRGALRVMVQARVCLQPDCADEPPFIGAWYDPADSLSPGTVLPTDDLPRGRYVQYRVALMRARASLDSPRLASMRLRGRP
ncbi:MAG: LamG domain-containing protein [Myxococcota bacterium]